MVREHGATGTARSRRRRPASSRAVPRHASPPRCRCRPTDISRRHLRPHRAPAFQHGRSPRRSLAHSASPPWPARPPGTRPAHRSAGALPRFNSRKYPWRRPTTNTMSEHARLAAHRLTRRRSGGRAARRWPGGKPSQPGARQPDSVQMPLQLDLRVASHASGGARPRWRGERSRSSWRQAVMATHPRRHEQAYHPEPVLADVILAVGRWLDALCRHRT